MTIRTKFLKSVRLFGLLAVVGLGVLVNPGSSEARQVDGPRIARTVIVEGDPRDGLDCYDEIWQGGFPGDNESNDSVRLPLLLIRLDPFSPPAIILDLNLNIPTFERAPQSSSLPKIVGRVKWGSR